MSYATSKAKMEMLMKQNAAPTLSHGRASDVSASEARAAALRKMGLKPEQHRDPCAIVNQPLTRKG